MVSSKKLLDAVQSEGIATLDIFSKEAFYGAKDVPLEDYVIGWDHPEWDDCIEELRGCKRFGFDLETMGFHNQNEALDPRKGFVRLATIGLPSRRAIVADFGGLPPNNRGLSRGEYKALFCSNRAAILQDFRMIRLMRVLKAALFNPKQQVWGHNLTFDQGFMLQHYGFEMRCVRDTMLFSQVIWAGLFRSFNKEASLKGVKKYSPHSLNAVAERVGITDVDKTEQKSDWGMELTNSQLNYAAYDSIVVLDVGKRLFQLVSADERDVSRKIWGRIHHCEGGKTPSIATAIRAECSASPVFAQMRHKGMPVNKPLLEAILGEYQQAADEAIAPFKAAFPYVNENSPAQLLEAFNKPPLSLGIQKTDDEALIPFKKSGKEVERALESDYADQSNNYVVDGKVTLQLGKIISGLLLYRSLMTQVKYLENIQKRLFKRGEWHWVGGDYTQIAPNGLGRSSCRKPNLQNPSNLTKEWKKLGLRSVRLIFEAPPGYKFIVADLSQAHAQIGREASQDPNLIKIKENGWDTHCVTASALSKQKGLNWDYHEAIARKKDDSHPEHGDLKALRATSKNVFYGSLNLQGAATLQRTANTQGVPMTLEEAKEAKAAWRDAYQGLDAYQKRAIKIANSFNHKYTATKDFNPGLFGEVRGVSGRRLFLEKWRNDRDWGPPQSVRGTDCVSHIWMSTEADAIKMAKGNLLTQYIDKNPEWDAHVCNFAHDEIDVVVKEEFALEMARACLKVEIDAMNQFVDYRDDAKPEEMIGQSWEDAK